MTPQLLSEVVRRLERKAFNNAMEIYDSIDEDFVVYDALVENILPGHARIARRVVDGLIGDTFQLSHDGSMIRKVRPPSNQP